MITKKTPTGLSSFRIVDDSSDSRNKVDNLTENNHNDLNFDFNENCPLFHYNIDSYFHQVVSRPNKATEELKLEARFPPLKDYIERDICSLNSKFQFVCNSLKTVNIIECKALTTLQKRTEFL